MTLYRKRLIPAETVKLKNDEIVYCEGDVIVTKWKPIKPRKDIGSGESCCVTGLGIKASRFYDTYGQFIYWYFDIISTNYNEETDEYVFTDMLADVVVYPDGSVKVLDIDELADALETGIITETELIDSLRKLSELLKIVYEKRIDDVFGKYFALESVK